MANDSPPDEWKGEWCGVLEIAQWAGVTKPQVNHWSKADWFPQPLDSPKMGRIYNFKEVVKVLSERGYPREVDASGKAINHKPVRRDRRSGPSEGALAAG